MTLPEKKTNRERFSNFSFEKGNALIYVLIAIALFAALSMTLTRQTDTGEAGDLSDEKAELYAVQLINYTAQAKSSLDQMIFSGVKINAIDFTLPNQTGFNTPPNGNKIYHPEGGGLNPGRLNAESIAQIDTDPPAGWYMGRFNNVEWTKTSAQDIILTAYQIHKKVCERINNKVNGSTDIPVISGPVRNVMLDAGLYNGTNDDLTTDTNNSPHICPECHKVPSLCVKDGTKNIYAFYTLLAVQ